MPSARSVTRSRYSFRVTLIALPKKPLTIAPANSLAIRWASTWSLSPRKKILGRMEVLGSVSSTLEALKKHPQDLIYSRNPWSVAFLTRTGVPFIWEAHEEHVHKRSKFLGAILQWLIVRTSKKPQMVKVVAISDALSKVWEGYGVPRDKLLTAHDGVDLKLFGTVMDKSDARKVLGITNNKKVIVYTGALRAIAVLR
ncbi:MAG: glycosyltransferase [bacterium]|nr:glycosyltransferase [bacterium]